jgi:hypothetical protein
VTLPDSVMAPDEFIRRSEAALRQPGALAHVHAEQRVDLNGGSISAAADVWLRADGVGRVEAVTKTAADDGTAGDEDIITVVLRDGQLEATTVTISADDGNSSQDVHSAEPGDCLGLPEAPGFDLLGCSGYAPYLFHVGGHLTPSDDTVVTVTTDTLDDRPVVALVVAARVGSWCATLNADATTFLPLAWYATGADSDLTYDASISFTTEALAPDALLEACFDDASLDILRQGEEPDMASMPADTPVFWLGADSTTTSDGQALALTRVVPGCHKPTHVAYGAGRLNEQLVIETWTRANWDAWWGDMIVDNLKGWPCVTVAEEPLGDGRATIYAAPAETFSEDPAGLCPGKPISNYFAIIQFDDVVVVVGGPLAEDTPDGFYPPNGAIQTRAALDDILAHLRRP